MVVVSIFHHVEFGRNDLPEHAPHFIVGIHSSGESQSTKSKRFFDSIIPINQISVSNIAYKTPQSYLPRRVFPSIVVTLLPRAGFEVNGHWEDPDELPTNLKCNF